MRSPPTTLTKMSSLDRAIPPCRCNTAKTSADLPTDGPKTLNGLILEYLETIPESGTDLEVEGYPIEIIETRENRVQLARIYLNEAAKSVAPD